MLAIGMAFWGSILAVNLAANSEKDSLLRKELDLFENVSGAPVLPLDSAREGIKFREDEWGSAALNYFKAKPHYLIGWEQKVRLPDPPVNTSERTRGELDYLFTLQAKRTPNHLQLIEKEKEFDVFYLGRSLGVKFNEKNLPVTKAFFQKVLDDLGVVVFGIKKQYSRARPHVLDQRIHPAIPVPPWAAYPSGHSSVAFADAFILQELCPTQKETFQQEAFLIGWHREVAGLHYPSDTSSGKLLARQIVDQMLKTPSFRADYEKSKQELEAAGFK
jgi:acid phosphatase (class A)